MKRPVILLSGLALLLLTSCATTATPPLVAPSTSQERSRPEGPLRFDDTIAYVSDELGNYEIFVLMAGELAVRLTETEEDESLPTWSPDGGQIAFGRREADNTMDVWVMNADGSGQRKIYDSGSVYLEGISWHANGGRVYFGRGYFDGPGNMGQKIVAVSVDDPETQQALSVGRLWDRHFTYTYPDVTRDGARIAFAHYEGYAMPFRHEIYVGHLSADGMSASNIVQLTGEQAGDSSPAWSRDGTAIAWVHETDIDSGNYDIWVMNADGSGMRQVTSEPGEEIDPVWSADGQGIIYASNEGGTFQLYMVYAWGDEQVLQLIDNDANNIHPDLRP
ncbi:MAG: hypothetical protein GTO63_26225 [Anaerolineae bacterium]|nr:hypothetical protein [Anaerolineae bacterium]NIN98232.1 hypothetical protein [Anaerolineae bacterium]NIQ81158.1 hypothetical protein [Anaerolineae bacterium]